MILTIAVLQRLRPLLGRDRVAAGAAPEHLPAGAVDEVEDQRARAVGVHRDGRRGGDHGAAVRVAEAGAVPVAVAVDGDLVLGPAVHGDEEVRQRRRRAPS